jgi:hypothetical protein
MLSQSSCTLDLKYNVLGTGLNNGDYEFEPMIVIWKSWGNNNRAVVDNLLPTGAIIKKILKKGEKVEQKAKEKLKNAKQKIKKSVKDRIKKEKQGIKEFRQERKERQLKEKEEKLKKQREKLEKKKKTKSSILDFGFDSDDDYDSDDNPETSESMSSEFSSMEDSIDEDEATNESDESDENDEDEDYYATESEDEYIMSLFNCKHGDNCSSCGMERKIKTFKEGKIQGPFSWPGTEENLRGDENLWLKLYIHTRHSGQNSIDKKEAPFIKRLQQAGVMKISMNHILIEVAKWMNNIEIDKSIEKIEKIGNNQFKVFYKSIFFAPKLAKVEYNKLIKHGVTDQKHIEQVLLNKCTKAEITTEITINNLTIPFMEKSLQTITNLQNQYNTLKYDQFVTKMKQQIKSPGPTNISANTVSSEDLTKIYIPFGSPLHENILEKAMTPLINNYISSLFVESPYGNKNHKALYQPSNKQVENLHLAYYSTEQGDQPVMSYLLRPRAEFDASSEEYFLIQLSAALKRNGLSPDYFIQIVSEQHKRTDSVILHNYLKCVETVYNLASFAATLDLYTSDFRYGNPQYTNKGKQVQIDSWDYDMSQGISNCDDCEGMGSLALEILDCLLEGRILSNNVKGWESPLLQSARTILLSRSHSGVAGTVNDAFVDASGQKISSKKIKDLPIIGEEIDTNSTVGGHFYGLSIPNAALSRWLKNSIDITKDNITPELKQFMNQEFKPWQYEENILVIEGTGNIDPFVLPLETSFKNDKIEFNKRKYQKELCEFIKTSSRLNDDDDDDESTIKTEQLLIKKNLESHQPNELFVLNHMLSVEGQPFYIKNTKNHNRISKFYKDLVHLLSKTLFKLDNSFSQCVFCYADNRKFGVDVGDILRDTGNKKSNIMIIRPLIPVNKDHWNVLIDPLIDTIKRQQSVSILGNFTTEDRSKLISKRLFQDQPLIQPSNLSLSNYMHLKEAERTIKVTDEKGYYIINGVIKNPVLVLEQGVQYNIQVDAKGHPFWILTDKDRKLKKNIENNGTDKGTIKIMIPCLNNVPTFLRYQCGKHDYMNGAIAIQMKEGCVSKGLSSSSGNDVRKPIDYKYEKPKWHFEEAAQNPHHTIMKFFLRPYNLEKHPGFLKCLKDEIAYLMKHRGVIDYAFYEQNFFPQGEPLIELLLLCNTKI